MSAELGVIRDTLRTVRPTSPAWLWEYIRRFYGLAVPRGRVCEDHAAPFEYIVGSFFDSTDGWTEEEKQLYKPHKDALVWAARGSGKTICGAIATHLDSIFRPGCETRILAGSADQARKMYQYKTDFDLRSFPDVVDGEPLMSRTAYRNGSAVEILAASSKSVRGTHVQRLKYDELEDFKPDILEAAQLVPQEQRGIPASVETFSTLHIQHGLMAEAVEQAGAPGSSVTIYKWCCFCVVERCPHQDCTPEKPHPDCAALVRHDLENKPHSFAEVCGGRAKRGSGYYKLEDLRRAFMRVTYESFQAEMLCARPKRSDAVYPMLDEYEHILKDNFYNPKSPLFIAFDAGYQHPFALWFQYDEGDVVLIHEYAPESIPLSDFIRNVAQEHERRGFKLAECGFCDPAGREMIEEINRSEYRGRLFVERSQTEPLGRVFGSDNRVVVGYEAVRKRLALYTDEHGEKRPRLYFSPCCVVTWRQMQKLHYAKDSLGEYTEEQVGVEDHGADCVRYAVRGYEWWWHRKQSPPAVFVCAVSG